MTADESSSMLSLSSLVRLVPRQNLLIESYGKHEATELKAQWDLSSEAQNIQQPGSEEEKILKKGSTKRLKKMTSSIEASKFCCPTVKIH